MNTTLSYPSDNFPAAPAITLSVPSHWQPLATADTLMAAIDPSTAVFQSNVTVSAERFPVALGLGDIAAQVIADRTERLTNHSVTKPPASSDSSRITWRATFLVAVNGEPLSLTQWTVLVDQPATTTQRYVVVGTLTMATADVQDNSADVLASLVAI